MDQELERARLVTVTNQHQSYPSELLLYCQVWCFLGLRVLLIRRWSQQCVNLVMLFCQILKTLHRTYTNMKLKPVWMDINPKAVTTDELFGYLHPATREWKDGEEGVIGN